MKGTVDHSQVTVDFSMSQVKGESTFKGVDTHNMSCLMNDQPISGNENVLLNSNNQSIRCSRAHEKIVFNSSEVKYYPPANVKVKTSTGDYRIELFEAIGQPMNDRLARIEAMLASQQIATNNTNAVLATIGQSKMTKTYTINGPRIGGPDKMTCPQGWVATSIHASGSVGGRYAVDGISQIIVTCSPIFNK